MNTDGMSQEEFEAYEEWVDEQEHRAEVARLQGEQLLSVGEMVGPGWLFEWFNEKHQAATSQAAAPDPFDVEDGLVGVEGISAYRPSDDDRRWAASHLN